MDRLSDVFITGIQGVFTIASPAGRYEVMKNRRFFGLSFCIDGQITYTHNGQRFVSDKNHAIILPRGQTYEIRRDKTGQFLLINFECTEDFCDTFIEIPIGDGEGFIRDFDRIKALSLFDGNNAGILSIIYDMLHRLSLSDRADGLLRPAIKYIEKNYKNPELSMSMLAKECCISEVYLRKLFVREMKRSPKQFVVDIRIQKAKQLLSEGVYKIGTVAEKCGFSNPYHFCRIFKEKSGLTPSEYARFNRNYII